MSSRAVTSDSHSMTQQHSQASPLEDMDSIVATYEQRIFRFHLISIRDRDVAQSLTQDTFIRAWSARESFRGDCSISTWLMRIALNLVRDHTRTDRFRFWKRVSETAVDVSDISSHIPHRDSSLESRLIASEQMALVWESVANSPSASAAYFFSASSKSWSSPRSPQHRPAYQHRKDSSLPRPRNHSGSP